MGSLILRLSDGCTHSKLFAHLDSVQNDERLCPRRVSFKVERWSSLAISAILARVVPRCHDHKDHLGGGSFVISSDPVMLPVGPDDGERSMRLKIPSARKRRIPWNKGKRHSAATIQKMRKKVPWNKGKRHSAETIEKIRERTSIAMRNRKDRRKLVSLSSKKSKECFFEWQNLIAEASRKGLFGEKEMNWNTYSILDEQLEKEWLDGIQLRKRPRPKGVKRAPMTLEHRRRITEAIVAKWADPDYRERVFSGMAKYHGTDVQSERKHGRRTSTEMMSDMLSTWKKKTDLAESVFSVGSIKQSTVWISNKSPYYDPLANSKLKMIKKIRSQRKATESEIVKAVEQTSLLIDQAEKAARALKFVAARSTTAHASLLETIKLIAEAVQLIEALEAQDISSRENSTCRLSGRGTGFFSQAVYEKIKCSWEEQSQRSTVNGSQSLVSSDGMDFDLSILTLQNLLNIKNQFTSPGSGGMNMSSSGTRQSSHSDQEKITPRQVRIKKWVRGRYVEVMEETL